MLQPALQGEVKMEVEEDADVGGVEAEVEVGAELGLKSKLFVQSLPSKWKLKLK